MTRFHFSCITDVMLKQDIQGGTVEDRLTSLSVVRLKVLQHLFLLHDFILGLIQLDPEDTNVLSLAPPT